MNWFYAYLGASTALCVLVVVRAWLLSRRRPWCFGMYEIGGYTSPRCESCRGREECEG